MYGSRATYDDFGDTGGRGAGLGIAYVHTTLDPSDPNNPNRALYMEGSSQGLAQIADALNSGDPYTMQRAHDNLFWPQADSGHHLGLMFDSTYQSTFNGPQGQAWFQTLNPAAQADIVATLKASGSDYLTIQGKSPQQLTQQLMGRVTQLVGTAAGVGSDGTHAWITDAYGPQSTGMKFTLNADNNTFTGSDGKQYTADAVRAELAASNAPVVQQHVDVPVYAPIPGAPDPTDPNTPPMGWRLGQWTDGTSGYWGPDGKFYVGKQPWNNPNAVGMSLPVAKPAPAPTPADPMHYTNPDGTPTYNGQPYSATDFANPYNNAGLTNTGGSTGGSTGSGTTVNQPPQYGLPGGGMIYPVGPGGGDPELLPVQVQVPASVGGVSTKTIAWGAGIAFGAWLLFGRRRS